MSSPSHITIRPYQDDDAHATWALFFKTVHTINCRDYTSDQVKAWAPEYFDPALWAKIMQQNQPFVAEQAGEIVGYADLQAAGLIDHFFCSADHQRQGIGRNLMLHLLTEAKNRHIYRLFAHVSVTAQPFFRHFGFRIVQRQQVTLRGQIFQNALMEKIQLPFSITNQPALK